MSKKIGIVIGSLRKNSYSQSIANYVLDNAPEGYTFSLIDVSKLPIYNQDYDAASPEEYTRFRNEILSLSGVLFITPEHNRSIPTVLKNALDVGSRPYGENVWNGKPGAIISHSPGAIGGFGANHHLRQILSFLNVLTLAQPEVYVGNYHTLIDKNGALDNKDTKTFFDGFLKTFADWIEKVS